MLSGVRSASVCRDSNTVGITDNNICNQIHDHRPRTCLHRAERENTGDHRPQRLVTDETDAAFPPGSVSSRTPEDADSDCLASLQV